MLWSPTAPPDIVSLDGQKAVSRPLLSEQASEGRAAVEIAVERAVKQPDDPEANFLAAAAEWGRGDQDASMRFLEKVLVLSPLHVKALMEMGRIEFDRGHYAEAARFYARARAIEPLHRIAAYRTFLCALLLGNDASLDEKVLPPDSIPGLYARAAAAWTGGDRASARDFVGAARAKTDPQSAIYEADLRLCGFFDAR